MITRKSDESLDEAIQRAAKAFNYKMLLARTEGLTIWFSETPSGTLVVRVYRDGVDIGQRHIRTGRE